MSKYNNRKSPVGKAIVRKMGSSPEFVGKKTLSHNNDGRPSGLLGKK